MSPYLSMNYQIDKPLANTKGFCEFLLCVVSALIALAYFPHLWGGQLCVSVPLWDTDEADRDFYWLCQFSEDDVEWKENKPGDRGVIINYMNSDLSPKLAPKEAAQDYGHMPAGLPYCIDHKDSHTDCPVAKMRVQK